MICSRNPWELVAVKPKYSRIYFFFRFHSETMSFVPSTSIELNICKFYLEKNICSLLGFLNAINYLQPLNFLTIVHKINTPHLDYSKTKKTPKILILTRFFSAETFHFKKKIKY